MKRYLPSSPQEAAAPPLSRGGAFKLSGSGGKMLSTFGLFAATFSCWLFGGIRLNNPSCRGWLPFIKIKTISRARASELRRLTSQGGTGKKKEKKGSGCCSFTHARPPLLLLPTPPSVNNGARASRNGWHYFNPSGAIFVTCPVMRQEQLPVAFHMHSCLFRAENALRHLSLPGTPKFAFLKTRSLSPRVGL